MKATADQNLHLLREIEANRSFLLLAYQQNPALLARAEPRIRQIFMTGAEPLSDEGAGSAAADPGTGAPCQHPAVPPAPTFPGGKPHEPPPK